MCPVQPCVPILKIRVLLPHHSQIKWTKDLVIHHRPTGELRTTPCQISFVEGLTMTTIGPTMAESRDTNIGTQILARTRKFNYSKKFCYLKSTYFFSKVYSQIFEHILLYSRIVQKMKLEYLYNFKKTRSKINKFFLKF